MSNPLYHTNLKDGEADEIDDLLLSTSTTPQNNSPPRPSSIPNPETYLVLPGKSHGSYSYPDLLVPTQRTHLGETWDQVSQSVPREGIMLTIRQYADFLSHLKSGRAVYDGKGARFDQSKVNALLDDILTVRSPYRAEWLDAKFSKMGLVRATWNITYHKIENDGRLTEVTEPLQDCLRENKTPGINLEYWLNNATQQGLPPKDTPNGNLYYWNPSDGRVARFGADSDGVDLGCNWDPRYSDGGLGVRVAKIKR